MDNEKVPEWALERAVDLYHHEPVASSDIAVVYKHALARYIAEHEDPPVDPLEQAVDNAFVRLPLEWTRETFVKAVADSLRADGVTRNPTREDSHAG